MQKLLRIPSVVILPLAITSVLQLTSCRAIKPLLTEMKPVFKEMEEAAPGVKKAISEFAPGAKKAISVASQDEKALVKMGFLPNEVKNTQAAHILKEASKELSEVEQKILIYSFHNAITAASQDINKRSFDSLQQMSNDYAASEAQKLQFLLNKETLAYISGTAATAAFAYYEGKQG